MRVLAKHINAMAVDIGGRYVWLLRDTTAAIEHIHHLVGQVDTSKGGVRGVVRVRIGGVVGGGANLVQDFEDLTTRLEAAKKRRAYDHLDVLQVP